MPFYAFHVEVPAPPDVVSSRLCGAVGRAPTMWESLAASWRARPLSGFPFVGRIKGLTFQIRCDSRFRNPFQPRIRAAVVPAAAGSRVNAWLFMHPLSFGFLLAFILSAPLGVAILAVLLGLWLFYQEALKTRALLAAAVDDSTMSAGSAPQAVRAGISYSPSRSTVRRVIALAVFLVLFAPLAIVIDYEYRLHSSRAFAIAMDLVSRSSESVATLGTPITAGAVLRGVVSEESEWGYAALSIPIEGSARKGTLYVVANRAGSDWEIARAILHTLNSSGGVEEFTLSPAAKPELFSYPSPGPVYLQPLDEGAAADLQELPAYYQARLNVDVIVLPTRELEPGTVESAAKQVIAEKAVEALEHAHPRIFSDVDAVLLAVTSQDLNIQTSGWDFATNYRRGRFGVMSTARLHDMPWHTDRNPAVYPARVRKMVTKNLALLRYPIGLSSDPSSVLATATFTAADVDAMGERFGGEADSARIDTTEAPCVSILQGPGGKQSWRLSCTGEPPDDSRFELFENYAGRPPFVMSRTDFSLGQRRSQAFVRKYRSQDDASRPFGIGASDSFDIFPSGDSQTFSWIELILADGARIHYRRTSPGKGFGDARLSARSYMSSPFSLSSMEWSTSGGWDLKTIDGWTYRFPSSGPGRTAQQSALFGLQSATGGSFVIRRNGSGDLNELIAPDGTAVEFTIDERHRISAAKEQSGRTVHYEYDDAGRLVHVRDSQIGDEFYEYDPLNRLTTVRDGRSRPLLVNAYGYMGEIRSQTLADGRRFLYECGYDASQQLASLTLTLPNGYTIEWLRTEDGFSRAWPQPPGAVASPQR